jgi:acyl-CoA synthetase (AMP-forming)/AMP-acid ligase II
LIAARTLWELVEARAAATPEALFAVDESGRRLSFAGYRDAALAAAAGLGERGVGPGVTVAWQLSTRFESIVLCAALARLGAIQNPILPIHRVREVEFAVRQAGARLLIVPGVLRGFDHAAMAREIAGRVSGLDVLELADRWPGGSAASLPVPPESAEAVRWIYYTSGTAADPKGARHSDATLLAASRGLADVLDLSPADRVALVFPFTHVGGANWLMAGLLAGSAHIVVERFDPAGTWQVLARHGVTLGAAGTVFHRAYLAAQRERPAERIFPDLRACPGGGAPRPSELHAELRDELGGVGVLSGYGLTECPIIAMGRVTDPDDRLAITEGQASPAGAEIRIVNGEIRVRGPQLFAGYVDSRLDAEAFDVDGFFRTGDLGALDGQGYLTITGRLKDVIIRKGENISAQEVENALHAHAAVADVAVVGLPDPVLGERCCAVVSTTPGARPLGFDAMVAFLRDAGLAVQKIPEQLEHVDELPRNPSGKVLKTELRSRYA